MIIKDLFQEDINRPINGVIKVDQNTIDVIEQEVREYVITKELKKHFIQFFDYYGDAFATPTADVGVWISGFFGSGKSHFLKMLSYILENREIDGKPTVEYFRNKFADDPATFMLIDKATKNVTETILFNIDIEGSINKDKTAVLRVFAKMFYNHLGFYGENLKVAKLEQFIAKKGKTAEFHRVFKEKNGEDWLNARDAFAFFEDDVVATLQEVLGMSETAAHNWFDGTETTEMSIAQLVSEIKDYVNSKPSNFRLLFMIDEVGQYVGTDTDLLLNLQSLVEKIGSECGGNVWVVCTGQEAIDEIIRVRENEFSRIQARFKNRLSLTSSSVDEVVQKRILKKKDTVVPDLEAVYSRNDSVLRNLFTFTDSMLDIKGYTGTTDFVVNYPFVPYQFTLMQRVFNEIRKHGNAGKHQSNGERSMLSGFQETAQRLQDKDEMTLVPFFMFYDTLHTFLDGSIRRVIERCERAAENRDGIELYDVSVLKLLYLVRYINNDIKATLDNIVILMADNIGTDKIALREKVRESLNRLLGQNYIGRSGEVYNFLTDEEQDIQSEIKKTVVDTASIVEKIGSIIYGDIYTNKKFRYGKYDFSFDEMVDGVNIGVMTGGMQLRFLSVATDAIEKTEMRLMMESAGRIIAVLGETQYYTALEQAMKIRKYIKQRNVAQLPKSVQDIIRAQQDEATIYENEAKEELQKAIETANFYVAGEHVTIKGGDAKARIEQALEYLVAHVYSELTLIEKNVESDEEVMNIAQGLTGHLAGLMPNQNAAAKVEEYLEMQSRRHLPTSMADVQSRYQAIPYGWKELDIAGVVAILIHDQKVTLKYAGVTVQPDNPKLADMLRKKTEVGKVQISKRVVVSETKMKQAKTFLREYFDVMDVPEDEDGLVKFIVSKFEEQQKHFQELLNRYNGHNYPNKRLVEESIRLMLDVLLQAKDNSALIDKVLNRQNDLLDNKDDMQAVESFFKNQVAVYDLATKFEADLRNDLDYISADEEANKSLNRIRAIVMGQSAETVYRSIPELNGLMDIVKTSHDKMLDEKRAEILEIVRQCMAEIHQGVQHHINLQTVSNKADEFYTQRKADINSCQSLALLDGMVQRILKYKDDTVSYIEVMTRPVPPKPVVATKEPEKKKVYKPVHRQILFPAKRLESQEDIDAYVAKVKEQLETLIKGCDGVEIK
ncbi:MAG: BREX system P-loop protein BrxC [Clostridiales bacterium]|nr:BREX system P-loop protein BrxC [Clostridiales bacterium]